MNFFNKFIKISVGYNSITVFETKIFKFRYFIAEWYTARCSNLKPLNHNFWTRGKVYTITWNDEVNEFILKHISEDLRVNRIFVNYKIKKKLCENHKGNEWLNKIRPWWGHDLHFHIRLNCPENETKCISQNPVASKDGCDETLEWWFSDEAKELFSEKKEPKTKKMPKECAEVFKYDYWKDESNTSNYSE